jgi:TRAP-type uncharacterized transport system fused permease subunit
VKPIIKSRHQKADRNGELLHRLILILRWVAFAGAIGIAYVLLLVLWGYPRYGSRSEASERCEFIGFIFLAASLLAAVIPIECLRKYRMGLGKLCLLCCVVGPVLAVWPNMEKAACLFGIWLPLMALIRYRPTIAAWRSAPIPTPEYQRPRNPDGE